MKVTLLKIALLGISLWAGLSAQTTAVQPTGATSTPATRAAALAQAVRQAFAGALPLARAGDAASAEVLLKAVNQNPAGTPAWELEIAGRLAQLAFNVREAGSPDASAPLARLALQHLSQCVKLATAEDTDCAGSAWEMTAYIQINFLGDLDAGEASYRQALQVNPALGSAQEALDRLLAAKAAMQQKLQAWSGQ